MPRGVYVRTERKHKQTIAIGDRFERLQIVARERHPTSGHMVWKAVCDCGTTKYVCATALRTGHTKSCGCYGMERITVQRAEGAHRRVLIHIRKRYVHQAKVRGHEWLLEDHTFEWLIGEPCAYCGDLASNIARFRGGELAYNGIDRVENGFGYIPGNVVPCCRRCNRSKETGTLKEFVDWAKRIVERTANYNIEGEAE